ncbi:hypothetical protein SPV_2525 [Streptococcus pneumoniae]|nr:hypothetical protein SPV_2525 [Streptococcus pneumoniae]
MYQQYVSVKFSDKGSRRKMKK